MADDIKNPHDLFFKETFTAQKLIEEGRQKGIREGIQEGIQKGKLEGKLEAIEMLLEIRFGTVGLSLMPGINKIAKLEQLNKIQALAKKAGTWQECLSRIQRLLE